jgi:hypothetical protein
MYNASEFSQKHFTWRNTLSASAEKDFGRVGLRTKFSNEKAEDIAELLDRPAGQGYRGKMPINRFLEQSCVGADEVALVKVAYEKALRDLHLVDRNNPITEIVAKKIGSSSSARLVSRKGSPGLQLFRLSPRLSFQPRHARGHGDRES